MENIVLSVQGAAVLAVVGAPIFALNIAESDRRNAYPSAVVSPVLQSL